MKTLLRLLLPLGAIALAAGIAVALVKTRAAPARASEEAALPVVETLRAERRAHAIAISSEGTVVPAERVVVQSEVAGRIVWLHDELVPGGRVRRGEVLLRVDPRDYAIQAEQTQAEMSRAELELEMERGRQVIAQREWELFGAAPEGDGAARARALREPQLRTANVLVKSATSAVERARLNLARTTIRAPFDAVVQSESVDLGQLVSPQMALAVLVGSRAFWVQVAVPVDQLPRIAVPSLGAAEGSRVRVVHEARDVRVERAGRVVRLLGELDPAGGMARLLVEVPEPLARPGGSLPLLLGAFVHVEIEAGEIADAVELPRRCLHEGNVVRLLRDDGTLEVRPAEVLWRGSETVLVRAGVADGERVIVTNLSSPITGMRLRDAASGAVAGRAASGEAARDAGASAR